MEYRMLGKSDLRVSTVGFGAWPIGGPAMAGMTPIGWGAVDDRQSKDALRAAFEAGITFYDTADFYGLGHSESIIGEVFGNMDKVVIATKVGHRITDDGTIALDYSKKHILEACEKSLRRLRRESIDVYQLHSAKRQHLESGECLTALEQLRQEGKVRHWGVSLNTFAPGPEGEFLLDHTEVGSLQLVHNVINRRAEPIIEKARQKGCGVIVRMALQFGLLTGRFTSSSTFEKDDHRSFRLTPEIMASVLSTLDPLWKEAEGRGISKTRLAMSFAAGHPGVSTVIAGMRSPEQVRENAASAELLPADLLQKVKAIPAELRETIVDMMKERG